MSGVRILAPAKLNLGLAVLGKRPDGYHEIDTIMTMVDLYDEVLITERAEPGVSIVGMNDVPLDQNLIYRAAMLWCVEAEHKPAYEIRVHKRIPSPGGVGGGSSDAAATLRALNALHGNPVERLRLYSLAAQLGADCPFFLGTATARATGIGTHLSPLPSPRDAVVIAIPHTEIRSKTASIYASLISTDYGDRQWINRIEQSLTDSRKLPPGELPNSFARSVAEIMPVVDELRATMKDQGITTSLSGAGPGFYVRANSAEVAEQSQVVVKSLIGSDGFVAVASFLEDLPEPEVIP